MHGAQAERPGAMKHKGGSRRRHAVTGVCGDPLLSLPAPPTGPPSNGPATPNQSACDPSTAGPTASCGGNAGVAAAGRKRTALAAGGTEQAVQRRRCDAAVDSSCSEDAAFEALLLAAAAGKCLHSSPGEESRRASAGSDGSSDGKSVSACDAPQLKQLLQQQPAAPPLLRLEQLLAQTHALPSPRQAQQLLPSPRGAFSCWPGSRAAAAPPTHAAHTSCQLAASSSMSAVLDSLAGALLKQRSSELRQYSNGRRQYSSEPASAAPSVPAGDWELWHSVVSSRVESILKDTDPQEARRLADAKSFLSQF